MGLLRNLQTSFAYRLRPSQFAAWIDAVSDFIDNFAAGTGSNFASRYVSAGGSDATGDGSFDKPFRTVTKAMVSITDADPVTKPYQVIVGPGSGFGANITVKNGVYVIGAGSGTGQYNGTPLVATTVLAPHTVQVLDASFAGGGTCTGGIRNCAFSQDFQADFQAIGSTGPGTFLLEDILSESNVIFNGVTAGNTGNAVTCHNIYINATKDLRLINLGASTLSNIISDFGGVLLYSQSAPIQSFHDLVGSEVSQLTLTWTSAAIGNFMSLNASANSIAETILTGNGALLLADLPLTRTMSDAANTLQFGTSATGTIVGVNGGRNLVVCTPTAARLLTIVRPNFVAVPTYIKVRNLATAFPIDIAFSAGTSDPGNPTYVPPSSELDIVYDPNLDQWLVKPYVQSGLSILAGGVVAALIPADITNNSRIVVTQMSHNGAAGVPQTTLGDRIVGTRRGGGGFKIHAVDLATGNDVATDNGTYNWQVSNSGG